MPSGFRVATKNSPTNRIIKIKQIIIGLLAMLLPALLNAQDVDATVGDIAKKLSGTINKTEFVKVSVVDFTDMQGHSSELGRYVAGLLEVELVADGNKFSVFNRSNLKSILQEHKLTAEGFVDPKNANN